ncbi:stabilizer of axonemal microtubules 2 isoform X1 [Lepisosteus oculatus]|uniref:stabilizer of axonemal microtubules 2 isoform X1 n=2 Tax=Lepisosteus oculatus TaxID=7918 RepID=UPI00371F938A
MEFPEFSCICELCDCGQHGHHKGCRKKKKTALQLSFGSDRCLLSHYKATFTQPRNVRLRSSKRPLRTPLHPNPPPMALHTTQRTAFGPPQAGERPRPACRGESYAPPQEPVQSQSVYSLDFPPKEPEPVVAKRPLTSLRRAPAGARLSQHTTTHDSYQGQQGAGLLRPGPRFGELPAVVGSLLCPDQREEMQTTTHSEFVRRSLSGGKPERSQPIQCSLRVEGERDLMTTHREVFQPHPLEGAPATRRRRAPKREEAPSGAPMETVTKYRSDFPTRQLTQPRSQLARPPPDNLKINQALRNDFRTVHRETYPGWDVSEHRRPSPAQLQEELSVRNREAIFQADTETKLAYRPVPLDSLQLEPLPRRDPVLKVQAGQFEDTTASKEFFQNWGVQRRARWGDLHDGVYIMPTGKFEGETTNSRTFFRKKAEMVTSFKPEHKPIQAEGEHDFTTVHRDTFRPLSIPPCRLQLYLAHQQQQSQKLMAPPAVPT